jgi:small GTP-binding protein
MTADQTTRQSDRASPIDQEVDPKVLEPIVAAIEAEFAKAPPTIAIIGLSGVGKSTIINSLFGTRRDVSATTRGTSRFHKRTFEIVSKRLYGASMKCALQIIDAPGLGEDTRLDDNYLKRYREHLPEADIALWVVAARNRALALDQHYLTQLSDVLPHVVLGINQVDLVDPLSWNEAINLPSKEQAANIATIVGDRREKLSATFARPIRAVPFSALRHYNLQALFGACLDEAPRHRRWMFEVLKAFSTRDWLAQAKGLSRQQRDALEAKYLAADAPLQPDNLPISEARRRQAPA